MGTLYDFQCESCGYQAEVSGGEDSGMAQTTTTIICADCTELYDVPTSDEAMTWKAQREVSIRCPKSSSHRWRLWEHPGPCPRCGAAMKRGTETAMWD